MKFEWSQRRLRGSLSRAKDRMWEARPMPHSSERVRQGGHCVSRTLTAYPLGLRIVDLEIFTEEVLHRDLLLLRQTVILRWKRHKQADVLSWYRTLKHELSFWNSISEKACSLCISAHTQWTNWVNSQEVCERARESVTSTPPVMLCDRSHFIGVSQLFISVSVMNHRLAWSVKEGIKVQNRPELHDIINNSFKCHSLEVTFGVLKQLKHTLQAFIFFIIPPGPCLFWRGGFVLVQTRW